MPAVHKEADSYLASLTSPTRYNWAAKQASTPISPNGAIKLTAKMADRPHTLAELAKMESVRNHLIDEGIYDLDGFNEYINNE